MGDDTTSIEVSSQTLDRISALRPHSDIPMDEFLAEMAETYAEAADEHPRPYLK